MKNISQVEYTDDRLFIIDEWSFVVIKYDSISEITKDEKLYHIYVKDNFDTHVISCADENDTEELFKVLIDHLKKIFIGG